MRRTAFLLVGAVTLLLGGAGPADADDRADAVFLHAGFGQDRVTFAFPAGDRATALARARHALAATGLPADGLTIRRHDGRLEARAHLELGEDAGFLRRRIPADRLAPLAAAGRVLVLELSPGVRVTSGRVRGADTDRLGPAYVVARGTDVSYSRPAWQLVAWGLLVLGLAMLWVPVRLLARRIERTDAPVEERAHRLRRLSLLSLPLVFIFPAILGVAGAIPLDLVGEAGVGGTAQLVLGGAVLLASTLGALVGTQVPPARALGRVRGITPNARLARRRIATAVVIGVGPLALWLIVRALLPDSSTVRLVALVAFVLLVQLLVPPVAVGMLPHRPLDPDTRSRLLELAHRGGVRVRDVRMIEGRSIRMANAALMGLFPRFRYIIVTDVLVDELTPEELDAVVAHEVGHGRHHDVARKLGALYGALLTVAVAVVALAALVHGQERAVVALLVPPLLLIAILLVQGLVGVRLEIRADDYASRATDPAVLHSALEKMGSINTMKRRTGRVWNLLHQHPGLQQRLDRLVAPPSSTPS